MKYFALILGGLGIDQWTKKIALKKYKHNDKKAVLGGNIYLTLYKNKGLMFDTFEKYPKRVRGLNIMALIVVCITFIHAIYTKIGKGIQFGLSLVLSGGLGNFYDRWKRGYVVDFFSFKIKPNIIFNIADWFIFIGLMIISFFQYFKKE